MMSLLLSLLATAQAATPAQPVACSAAVRTALLKSPGRGNPAFALGCNLRLAPDDVVRMPLLLAGAKASGVTIDCNGGTIAGGGAGPNGAPAVSIQSQWLGAGDRWARPSGITIRNCKIIGPVSIGGKWVGSGFPSQKAQSRRADFTALSQRAAPTNIRIENSRFQANGTIPLYIGRGATMVSVVGARFSGRAPLAVYLSSESARNRIENSDFAMATTREQIAIDGSAGNVIAGNRFALGLKDGIWLYRNCGENGVIRHQTPSNNKITDNRFTRPGGSSARAVVENARTGRPKPAYCTLDKGFAFGSSADDNDNGRDNILARNQMTVR